METNKLVEKNQQEYKNIVEKYKQFLGKWVLVRLALVALVLWTVLNAYNILSGKGNYLPFERPLEFIVIILALSFVFEVVAHVIKANWEGFKWGYKMSKKTRGK